VPIDSIVRVSFQTQAEANQAVNSALVGHPQHKSGPGPFRRIGTAVYSCSDADELQIAQAVSKLFAALSEHAIKIDFVSITMAHKEPIRYKRVKRN